MGIKTVSHTPYSPDLAPCDFWSFSKLKGCRYERIEEIKEAVEKVTDTLTKEDFHGATQKLLERYNKCIATGEDYFGGDKSFLCVLSIKVPIQKSLETYLIILVYMYMTNFLARAGRDTMSVFKRYLTGFKSEFSFFKAGCHAKGKQPILPYNLTTARVRIVGFLPSPRY